MKKILLLLLLSLLLAGCGTQTFETMGDISHVSATEPAPRKMTLSLPEDASVLTAFGEDTLYTCDDYTITLQVLQAGDLSATVSGLCGYEATDLTVMETVCGDHTRYEWVWTAAGEGGDMVCRAAVIDDGNYHYSLCVMADAETAGSLTDDWNALFASFCLAV